VSAGGRLAIGALLLDLNAGELLTAEGRRAPLRRQALELLLVLGRNAGQVVTKDELMDRVWPGVVVGEGSLTQTVADVRKALGDTGHQWLKNVARRGYMLVAEPRSDAPALSLVVLPPATDGDAGQWLADALQGDLIYELTRLYGVLVIARDTAASYRGRTIDPRMLARELGVRFVVCANLRREGERVRLVPSLIDGSSGAQLWTEAIVVDRGELPQMLADLAMRIVRMIQPELIRAAAASRAALSPLEVTADDLAMRGFAAWGRGGVRREHVVEALALCERAVALDADSLRGWAGLVFIQVHGLNNGWLDDAAAARRRIAEAVDQVERLGQDDNYVWQSRTIRAFVQRDPAAMLRITTAWSQRGSLPAAHAAHGLALVMNDRFDDAVPELERALRLSPRDPLLADWQYRLAMAHFAAGRLELACEWSMSAAVNNPALPGPPIHAAALALIGDGVAAQQAFDEHMGRLPQYAAEHLFMRWPAGGPAFRCARSKLVEALQRLGLH